MKTKRIIRCKVLRTVSGTEKCHINLLRFSIKCLAISVLPTSKQQQQGKPFAKRLPTSEKL